MKKATSVLIWFLIILTSIFPAGALISTCFGYIFTLLYIPVFAVIIALLSVFAVVFSFCFKYAPESKVMGIILSVIAPISLLNYVCFVLECPRISVVVCCVIIFAVCCCLTVCHGKPFWLKLVSLSLSVILISPICLLSSLSLYFGDFGQRTVIETAESPNGKYYAQVIDSDQGALGGDTIVDVYTKGEINAIIAKIEKMPKVVYRGGWGEFENMRIYWKNDETLVINSVEYGIE